MAAYYEKAVPSKNFQNSTVSMHLHKDNTGPSRRLGMALKVERLMKITM
jgi:hypothetical protein